MMVFARGDPQSLGRGRIDLSSFEQRAERVFMGGRLAFEAAGGIPKARHLLERKI